MGEEWLERGQGLPDFEDTAGPGEGRQRAAPAGGLAGLIRSLAPWQRFVLTLLLFLDIALLGCMCLVMTGRVVPFSP